MLDVEIHNFQSIEHTRVRVEGFTSLVGRSNLGKSAIVRAIKSALTGAPEEGSVRHGPTCLREVKGLKSCKCYCSVHIKTDGFDLLWEKGGDRNEYIFNGTKYTAVGKGTPDFLGTDFGPVKIGDDKILLQVADQFKSEGGGPIFLLDQSGSVVADVLSDVAQLDRINVATRLSEKDRKDAIAQRKVREKDVMALKIKSVGYDGLDEVLLKVKEVEVDEQRVVNLRARRDRVVWFRETFLRVGRQLKACLDASKVPMPVFDSVPVGQSKWSALASYIVETEARQAVITSLQGVDTIVVPDMAAIPPKLEGFQKLHAWLLRLRAAKEFFTRYKAMEAVAVPDLESLQTSSKKALTLAVLRARHTALGQLQEFLTRSKFVEESVVPEIDDLQTSSKKTYALGSLRARHTGLDRQVTSLERALADSDSEKEVALGILRIRQGHTERQVAKLEQLLAAVDKEHQEIKTEESDLGVCPTCTQPVVGLSHEHAAE